MSRSSDPSWKPAPSRRAALYALAEFNGDLYVGGWFDEVDLLPIESFGIWSYSPEGDANGDLKVDLSDLGIVLRSFSTCNGNPLFDPAAGRLGDNGNNCVDLEDLGEVLASWGATCDAGDLLPQDIEEIARP